MSVLVGVMSGTSLDGVSAAVVRFREKDGGRVQAEMLSFVTHPYTAAQRERLASAMVGVSPEEYARLDFELGAWLADAAAAAIGESGVARADIAAIASHGHTIWHDAPRATWQMGNAAVIAERTGVAVVSDFRSRDIAAGGQGAPLVTIADALLFNAEAAWRALLNIGGIANVQIIPPGGVLESVRAFDTGPGVCVIDATVRSLLPQLTMDRDGALAQRGTAIESVVRELLSDPYFSAAPPKSTGRELFTPQYVSRLAQACRATNTACTTEDIVATATLLTARSIALAFSKFVPEPVSEMLVSGGGANNPSLIAMLRSELAQSARERSESAPAVVPFSDRYFDGDAKEAVAFAFLGWLHLKGRPGNVPNATGARGARVLGNFTPA